MFREQLLRPGLLEYLYEKLLSDPTFLQVIGAFPVMELLPSTLEQCISQRSGPGVNILLFSLKSRVLNPNRADNFESMSAWRELLTSICRWSAEDQNRATSILSFLLEERILLEFLKADADPSAQIIGPGSTFGGTRCRAVAVMYLELCFKVLKQSQPIQTLYLEVLKEIFRLSDFDTLLEACDEFITVLSHTSAQELARWDLPSLVRVHEVLSLRLSSCRDMSKAARTKDLLDQTASQVLPHRLHASSNPTTTENARGKRKRKAKSGNSQKKPKRKD